MIRNTWLVLALSAVTALGISACTTTATTTGWQGSQAGSTKGGEVGATIARFKSRDPSIKSYFEHAYAYAVFPTVGKGGLGVGGAYGDGYVYRHGKMVGKTTLTQLTVGFQLGGQAYSEVIFFRDESAFKHFEGGNFEFDAQASAVAATVGAAANAGYRRGVVVFTLAKGGLMYEATIGGQKFSYTPVK